MDEVLPPEQAGQQLAAMEAAWEGASEEGPQEQQQRQQQAWGGPEVQAAPQGQRQEQGAPDIGKTGGTRGQSELTNTDSAEQGLGAVNMEEAVEAVEAGSTASCKVNTAAPGGAAGSGDTPAQAQQQQEKRRVPVAVDADRASFERLLLMPDMLNDHLPDRYCQALKQL